METAFDRLKREIQPIVIRRQIKTDTYIQKLYNYMVLGDSCYCDNDIKSAFALYRGTIDLYLALKSYSSKNDPAALPKLENFRVKFIEEVLGKLEVLATKLKTVKIPQACSDEVFVQALHAKYPPAIPFDLIPAEATVPTAERKSETPSKTSSITPDVHVGIATDPSLEAQVGAMSTLDKSASASLSNTLAAVTLHPTNESMQTPSLTSADAVDTPPKVQSTSTPAYPDQPGSIKPSGTNSWSSLTAPVQWKGLSPPTTTAPQSTPQNGLSKEAQATIPSSSIPQPSLLVSAPPRQTATTESPLPSTSKAELYPKLPRDSLPNQPLPPLPIPPSTALLRPSQPPVSAAYSTSSYATSELNSAYGTGPIPVPQNLRTPSEKDAVPPLCTSQVYPSIAPQTGTIPPPSAAPSLSQEKAEHIEYAPAIPTPGLARVHFPVVLIRQFLELALPNTRTNIETAAVLAGVRAGGDYFVTHMVFPKQKGSSDNVETEGEEELIDWQEQNRVLILGWIHTHPTQSCFLSSIDLHCQFGYQIMVPEAIAIVCAPSQGRTGIFSLTQLGMQVIGNCQKTRFHTHDPDHGLYLETPHVTTHYPKSHQSHNAALAESLSRDPAKKKALMFDGVHVTDLRSKQ